jgi:hypothetical protein
VGDAGRRALRAPVTPGDDVSVQTRSIRVVNPATEQEVAEYDEHTPAEIESAITAAHDAQPRGATSASTSGRIVRAAAAVLRRRRDEFAHLITTETGKPLAQAAAEVEKCAWTCDFFADQGPAFLADRPVETTAESSYVAYEPLGARATGPARPPRGAGRAGARLGRRRRPPAHRRTPPRSPGVLLRADRPRRRAAGDAGVPPGDVRAGRRCHPCPRRGPCARACQ